MSTRRGMTLAEVGLYAVVAGLLLEAGTEVVETLRAADDRQGVVAAAALDAACDRLRRDLAAGARVEDGVLVAGGSRWRWRDGRLERDGRALVALRAAEWSADAGVWRIRLQPAQGPERLVVVGGAP